MKTVKVLDVTLRDGGCVNDFQFGQVYMDKILYELEKSGVDYIELGYIDEKNGTESGTTKFCNEQAIFKNFLKSKKPNITYVAMMDYGKFDVDKLMHRTETGIDGIRLAFHKKDYHAALKLGKKIIEKGYQLYIQPMITLRYTDGELLGLIEAVNDMLSEASGFYIVDSFGEMRSNDMNRVLNLVDHNLIPTMTLGFHSHNNLQLSYSNAMTFIDFPTQRQLIIDSSVMGMGKGAGNLNTELLLEHLNLYYSKNYDITPLMVLIDSVISVIHKEFYWGYSAEYYLSSINGCTPSYASFFYGKHMLPISDVAKLLSMIEDDKKISFDKEYAESIYLEYNKEKQVDDTEVIEELRGKLENKTILVLAPGKTILEYESCINEIMSRKDVITIGLNNNKYNNDFIFITRKERLEWGLGLGIPIIAPSSVVKESKEEVYVVDYNKWIVCEEEAQDASGVMVLNILKALNVRKILLAGFDGFSGDINGNYYDKNMRIPMSSCEAETRNAFYFKYISKLKREVQLEFITPSLYEKQV